MSQIALISEHASPLGALGGADSGGQNVYVGQVARNLARMGHRVDVFTRRDNPMLPEVADWLGGVRLVHVPAGPPVSIRKEDLLPFMPDFTEHIIRFAKSRPRPYDIVHANFWMSGLAAADLKKTLGIPFVITFHALGRIRRLHQGAADQFPETRFEIEDRIVREADRIIAECAQDEDDFLRLYNADPQRISMIPCGFDPSEFVPMSKELARMLIGLRPDERILLQLGRLVPRKGIDNVVRAVARLRSEYGIEAKLLVVGGESDEPDPAATPEIGRLQAIASEEQVSAAVEFAGRRGRDVLKFYYNAADVFLTTPHYEPFGITPLESMACGTPVIGSNVGGIKSTVVDGVTGFLVPPNDPGALAGRIAQIYRNPELARQFRERGIQRANELYTWPQVARSIESLYRQVIGCGRARTVVPAVDVIDRAFNGAIEVLQLARRRLRAPLDHAVERLGKCFRHGNKVLVCGNGGSAAEAMHFSAELLGRFRSDGRPALPVIALCADSAFLTAWSNDFAYEQAFARQVNAYGQVGDILLGFSTSGRSPNLIQAFLAARERGLDTIALLGGDGGDLRQLADIPLVVPSRNPQHTQETHLLLIHLICEMVEANLAAGIVAPIAAEKAPDWVETAPLVTGGTEPRPSGSGGLTRTRVS